MNNKPYLKFKGLLASRGIKQKEVANLLEVTEPTFSRKINRQNADFNPNEIKVMCMKYKIKAQEFFLDQKLFDRN